MYPLSEREMEILRLVATGLATRRVAEKLHISDKTVARHVSNIFTKLDLTRGAPRWLTPTTTSWCEGFRTRRVPDYNPSHKCLESPMPNSDRLAFVVQLPDCS